MNYVIQRALPELTKLIGQTRSYLDNVHDLSTRFRQTADNALIALGSDAFAESFRGPMQQLIDTGHNTLTALLKQVTSLVELLQGAARVGGTDRWAADGIDRAARR